MRENQLQADCIVYLKKHGIYHTNTHGGPWEQRGRPDLYICYKGWFIGCELKRGVDNAPTPLQEKHLREIRENGGIGLWVTTVAELDRLLCSLHSMAGS